MSTPFEQFAERIANKMIADMKTGVSIFQRPDINYNSALPFNIESGKRYTGPSALALLMQKRDDPRWATSNQANRNHTAVMKGMVGTTIAFPSMYAIRKMENENGPVLKENGKQRTERVKLDEPEIVQARLFNGEQLRKLPKWEKETNSLSPAERSELILKNSGAVIEHGGDDMLYDTRIDTILLPEKQQFATPEQYYAEALHQLAHWTSAEDRLNRPQKASIDQLSNIREELRTNLASLFLAKELNLPFDLNYHVGYMNSWSLLLKDEPLELFDAVDDAQKIVDKVLGFEKKAERKQEAGAEASQETGLQNETGAGQQPDPVIAPDIKYNPEKLTKGEIIPHNGTEFKVLAELKNKVYQMQDTSDGRKFKMSSKDALYNQLLEAKNNSQEIVMNREAEEDELHLDREEDAITFSMAL